MLNPIKRHLDQYGMINRCAGGSLDGSGQTFNFESGTSPFLGGTIQNFNGSKVLGGLSGASATQIQFDYNGDAEGVFIEFDFYEIDSWDNEQFKITIAGNVVDLGTFQVNRDSDMGVRAGESNGIYWYKSQSSDQSAMGGSGWQDQLHTFRVFVPADKLAGATTVLVSLAGNLNSSVTDESWAIDNFKARDATANDVDQFFLLNGEENGAKADIQNIALDESTANASVGSLWNTFSARLSNNGLSGTMNEITGAFAHQNLDQLGTDKLKNLGNETTNSMNTWSSSSVGFGDWADKLWNAVDSATTVNDNLLQKITLAASFMSNAATFAAPGPGGFGTAAAGVSATVGLIQSQTAGDLEVTLPTTPPQMTITSAFQEIYNELKERGEDTVANNMNTAVTNGFKSYSDFMANAQLASVVLDIKTNEGNADISPVDFDAIRDLGFNVSVSESYGIIGRGQYVYYWDVDITDGTTDLETSRVEYKISQNAAGDPNAHDPDNFAQVFNVYNFDVV